MVSKRTVQRRRNSKLQKRRSLKRKNVKSRKVMRGGEGKDLTSVQKGDRVKVNFERLVCDVYNTESLKSPNYEKLAMYTLEPSHSFDETFTVLKNDNGLLEFDQNSLRDLVKIQCNGMVKLRYAIHSDKGVILVDFNNPYGQFYFMCNDNIIGIIPTTDKVTIFDKSYYIYLRVNSVTTINEENA
jgi:hypothetical protein